MDPALLLSAIVFLPALGALGLAFVPKELRDVHRLATLFVTILVFAATLVLLFVRFQVGDAAMQQSFAMDWIPSFNIFYSMGVDGISLPLVVLTSFLCVLAMGASWNIEKHVKAYCMLFLVLETGILGVFVSLDFFLFYVFWEVMLLPMYFLIGVWGGPRREYAAIKFFIYTLLGGVFMLIALLMLYFNSDLRLLDEAQMQAARLPASAIEATLAAPSIADEPQRQIHTFNILAMAQIGQLDNSPYNAEVLLGKSIQWWSFLLLFIGFAIKVPVVPVHTWLPDAHVEAPTPISMLLAGILLKLGGYGILRFCYPICPDAGYDLAWFVVGIGVLSMVYGAFAAMAQKDFKRLVAYSSVSHMGYVIVGLGVWSAWAGTEFNPDYWNMGVNGAMFQMIAHGISSAGMFFMVGVVYDRVHHRNLDEFGGLFAKMPVYSGMAFVLFFAGLGLPGLCGFIGEFWVTLSVWNYSHVLAVISACVVILTAGYILWTLQRVYLGPEYKGPHGDHLTPATFRELAIATPLVVLAIVLGVVPQQTVFRYTEPTIGAEVGRLAEWTKNVKEPRLLQEKAQEQETAVAREGAAPAPKFNAAAPGAARQPADLAAIEAR